MKDDWKTFVYYILALSPVCVLVCAGWKPFLVTAGICLVIGILIVAGLYTYEEKVERPQMLKEIEKWNSKAKNKENIAISERNNTLSKLGQKYGKCSKSIEFNNKIIYEKNLFKNSVRVYMDSSVIVIDWGKHIISFSDIVKVSVHDDSNPNMGPVSSQTETDGKSMLGRAAAGYVIAGGVGAVIGGATAKQNTTYSYLGNKHDFYVLIYTKDIEKSLIKLHTGDDVNKTQEIESLLTAIIERNKQ